MLTDELKNLQAELIAHPIYNATKTMDELHRFMRDPRLRGMGFHESDQSPAGFLDVRLDPMDFPGG